MCFPDTGNSYESGVCVCLQRPGKVRNPPEVRSSGGSGGGSGDGKPGTFPRVPNFPVMRRTPGESLQTSSGRGEDAGSPSGGQAGARGLTPSGVPGLLLPPLSRGCPPQLVGARPRRELCPWRALAFGSRRGRLESGEALLAFAPPAAPCLPPSGARWYHYLFPAAAPSDSCR